MRRNHALPSFTGRSSIVGPMIAILSTLVFLDGIVAQEVPANRTEAFQHLRQAMATSVSGDVKSARKKAEQVRQWARAESDELTQAWANEVIGQIELSAGQIDAASAAFDEALPVFDRLSKTQPAATCHANLGRIAMSQGKLTESIEHFEEALERYQSLSLTAQMGITLVDLGEARQLAGKIDDAMDSFSRALSLLKSAKDAESQSNRVQAALGLAACFRQKKEYAKAEQTLQTLELDKGNQSTQARIANEFALVYHHLGKHKEALQQYDRAVELYRQLGDTSALSQLLNNRGALYREMSRFEEASADLRQALQVHDDLPTEDQARIIYNIALVHEDQGQIDQAINRFERVFLLKQSYGDNEGCAMVLDNLALLYAGRGEATKAKKYAQEAENLRRGR